MRKKDLTIHNKLSEEMHKTLLGTCSNEELNTQLLIAIHAFLDHMDLMMSRLTDLVMDEQKRKEGKGGQTDEQKAS